MPKMLSSSPSSSSSSSSWSRCRPSEPMVCIMLGALDPTVRMKSRPSLPPPRPSREWTRFTPRDERARDGLAGAVAMAHPMSWASSWSSFPAWASIQARPLKPPPKRLKRPDLGGGARSFGCVRMKSSCVRMKSASSVSSSCPCCRVALLLPLLVCAAASEAVDENNVSGDEDEAVKTSPADLPPVFIWDELVLPLLVALSRKPVDPSDALDRVRISPAGREL